jgi:hypothetical protein
MDTPPPFDQGRALWVLLGEKHGITSDELRLFMALEEVYDEPLMRERERLERLDERVAWQAARRRRSGST